MHSKPYLAEEKPRCRLIIDEPPPTGTRIYMISQYGAGCIGHWDKCMTDVVAWAYLPKMSREQKQRINEFRASANSSAGSSSVCGDPSSPPPGHSATSC